MTGASSGIGRAVAQRLAPSRRLILQGRDRDRLAQTAALCACPQSHLLWIHVFRDAAQLAPALSTLLAENSAGVEGFVHCAGVAHVLSARLSELDAVLESLNVNYISAQRIISTLLKKRINPPGLRAVVAISSIWGQSGARGHSLYCASKAALDGMVRALAVELAPEVRVNSVLPGAVQTPMAEAALTASSIVQRLGQDYPLGLGQADDVAAAVEFLMSDNARWITGHQLVVDGGRTVNMSL